MKKISTSTLQRPMVICLLAAFCCLLWGSAFPAVKIGYGLLSISSADSAEQLIFAGLRFFFAGVVAVLFHSASLRRLRLPARSSLWKATKLGLIQTLVQYALFYIGMAHTSGVKGSVLMAVHVFFAILISAKLFHYERLNAPKLLGCLCGFGGVLLIIILATLLATLSPYDPIAVETGQKFLPPSAQHLLGTDNFGRDTFTRLLYGGRVSLLVGFLSMLISIVFGTVYGIVSGSSGKLVDGFMMRIVDILMSVPSFLIIITLNIYMNAGIRTLVVTIGLFSWMGVARIVRAEVLSLRERDFILASEGLGARKSWVITRHFARNVFSPVLVASTNSIASAILTESSLSYLGFGISIPNPSWGGMLEGAQTYILTHPSLAVYPGVCILLTVLCFNVLGNGFRRRFSPNSGR